jgi:hypothetical protein
MAELARRVSQAKRRLQAVPGGRQLAAAASDERDSAGAAE